MRGTVADPCLHHRCPGCTADGFGCFAPASRVGHVFTVDAAPREVRIVSRASAPAELGLSRDPRLLGIAVRRVAITNGRHRRTIEAWDDCLCAGFHGYEPETDIRWTAGDARLPERLFNGCSGLIDIQIETGGATRYFDEGTPQAA